VDCLVVVVLNANAICVQTVEAKPVAAKEAPVQAQAGTITKTKSTGYTLQIVILLVIVAFGLGFQLSNIAFP